jgi:hypothetical protein
MLNGYRFRRLRSPLFFARGRIKILIFSRAWLATRLIDLLAIYRDNTSIHAQHEPPNALARHPTLSSGWADLLYIHRGPRPAIRGNSLTSAVKTNRVIHGAHDGATPNIAAINGHI